MCRPIPRDRQTRSDRDELAMDVPRRAQGRRERFAPGIALARHRYRDGAHTHSHRAARRALSAQPRPWLGGRARQARAAFSPTNRGEAMKRTRYLLVLLLSVVVIGAARV